MERSIVGTCVRNPIMKMPNPTVLADPELLTKVDSKKANPTFERAIESMQSYNNNTSEN